MILTLEEPLHPRPWQKLPTVGALLHFNGHTDYSSHRSQLKRGIPYCIRISTAHNLPTADLSPMQIQSVDGSNLVQHIVESMSASRGRDIY
jgi:hypothetical protein